MERVYFNAHIRELVETNAALIYTIRMNESTHFISRDVKILLYKM